MMLVRDGDHYRIDPSLTEEIDVNGQIAQIVVAEALNKVYLNDNVKHLLFRGSEKKHRILAVSYTAADMKLDVVQSNYNDHDVEIDGILYDGGAGGGAEGGEEVVLY